MLVLSQYVERIYARELLADGQGGVGYLLKERVGDVREFVDGLRRVAGGGTVLDPEVVAAVMARQQPVERLTPREREVLALMAEGRSNAAIAADLVVTEKAVAKHTNNIFAKLDLPAGARRPPAGAGCPRLARRLGPVSLLLGGVQQAMERGWLDV